MKEIEATRLKLAAMELVEGTDLSWYSCIRTPESKEVASCAPCFNGPIKNYELALGIIEGKPVWAGDTPYFDGKKTVIYPHYLYQFNKDWSWLPPKPRTAMVELLVEDIEYWVEQHKRCSAETAGTLPKSYVEPSTRFYVACRKTLEGLK